MLWLFLFILFVGIGVWMTIAGLVFERGREAFLQKMKADARLKDAQANKEKIQVKRESFELERDQMDYLIEVSDKMEIPEVKEQLKATKGD